MTGTVPGLRIDGPRLLAQLEELARFGATPDGGVGRTSYSAADLAAREWLAAQCTAAGLKMRTDGLGNIFIRVPAATEAAANEPVWLGSHIDSVPNGGWLDGALGSMAALEVARRLAEERVPLRRPVEVVIFADEEGCYHHLLGSTGLVRDYSRAELEKLRGRDGGRLVDALRQAGRDVDAATSTALRADSVHAFVELHIEQGSVLESEQMNIGVVTSIVGMGGGQLTFHGRADHAGTTPMHHRRDALRGAGELLTRLPDITASISGTAVATCGILDVEPGGANVVPETARLQLDFRDTELERILALEEAIVDAARSAGRQHGLEVHYQRDSITDPAPLDPRIQDLIETTAAAQGLRTRRLPSGAGHDSQNMSRIAPTGMIFIPSIDGRSHSPAENSRPEDIEAGANVLLATILALCSP